MQKQHERLEDGGGKRTMDYSIDYVMRKIIFGIFYVFTTLKVSMKIYPN